VFFPGCPNNLMAMSGGFLALQARKAKEKKKVAELEDAFKAADTDGDGKLSLHEWMEALKQSGHNVSRSEVEEIFKEKDRDFDGTMSYEEFTGHDTKTELAFRAIDKNGDGYVSKAEFKRICPNMTKEQMEAAFTKFDKDGTGKINYREFCQMLNKKK